ncbi:MAG: T9SS type A sorting domain-containing protein, partial [Cytophagales bacterium]
GSIAIRPVITTVGVADGYITRAFEISTMGINPSFAQIQFNYDEPNERVGQPNQVIRYLGGTNVALPAMIVNTVAGTFGFNGTVSNLNGLYVAQTPYIAPTLTGLSMPLIICQNGSFNAVVSGTGSSFPLGNVFSLIQADNADVNYTNPTIVGTLAGTNANFIYNFTLPSGIAVGRSRFKIQPSFSNQSILPEIVNLNIIGLPQFTGLSLPRVFVGDMASFTGSSLITANAITISGNNTAGSFASPNPNQALAFTFTNAAVPLGFITVTGSNQCGIGNSSTLVSTFLGTRVTSINITKSNDIAIQEGFSLISAVANALPSNTNVSFQLINPNNALPLATIVGSTIAGANPNLLQIQAIDNGVVTIVATSISNPNISNAIVVNITNQASIRVSVLPTGNLCAGQFYTASTTISGSAGGNMVLLLSDATGSFVAPTTISSFAFATGIANNSFSIPSNAVGTAYRVRVVKAGFLSYVSSEFAINVLPNYALPVKAVVPELCLSSSGSLVIANSQTTSDYRLYRSNGSPITPGVVAGNGGDLVFTIAGVDLPLGNNAFTMKTRSNVGCGSPTLLDMNTVDGINVVDNPTTNNSVSASQPVVCADNSIEIAVENAQNGVLYTLFNNAILQFSKVGLGNNLTFTVPSANLIAGSNGFRVDAITPACGLSLPLIATTTVTVINLPTINVVPDQNICSGNTFNVSFTGSPSQTAFDWQVANQSGNVFGQADGTGSFISQVLAGAGNFDYIITPILGNCAGTATKFNVNLTNPPKQDLAVESITVCGGNTATIKVFNAEANVNYFAVRELNTFAGSNIVNSDFLIDIPQASLASSTGSSYQFLIYANTAVCTPRLLDNIAEIKVVSPITPPVITVVTLSGQGLLNCDKLKLQLSVTQSPDYLSYQWKWNDRVIVDTTANTTFYVPVIDGTYKVDVYGILNCRRTTDPVVVQLTNATTAPSIIGIGSGINIVLESSQAASYQWYYNKKAIIGEVARQYKPLYNASYSVKVNPGDLCSLKSNAFSVNGFAEDLARQSFEQTDSTIIINPQVESIRSALKVYPNPAKNNVVLSLNTGSGSSIWLIKFFNSVGMEVYSSQYAAQNGRMEFSVDISNFPTGMYKILVSGNNNQYKTNLIIE